MSTEWRRYREQAFTRSTHWCHFSHNWTNIQWKGITSTGWLYLTRQMETSTAPTDLLRQLLHRILPLIVFHSLSQSCTTISPEHYRFYTVGLKTLKIKYMTSTKKKNGLHMKKKTLKMNLWEHHGGSEWEMSHEQRYRGKVRIWILLSPLPFSNKHLHKEGWSRVVLWVSGWIWSGSEHATS